ncbi:MAG: TolC family protein [Deltaproteobacteria bacterium]|nr:TolC family protein [Deltaproteobacteria bacterium]
MTIIRNTFVLICVFVLSTACATVQENQAFSNWNEEALKWNRTDEENVHLPELDENASLDVYVLYAMLNNPGLRAAFDRWKAALDQVGPAQTLPDPRFSYANYIREVETRVGAQEHKFGLAQTFPWFGKLGLQGDIALQAAYAEQQRYEAAKLDLIYRVKNIYYEYSYLADAITITKDNVTLLTYLEGVARTKYKSGAGLQSAVIKAQLELGKLEDRLHSLQDLIKPMMTKLNMALNRPSNLSLPMPKGLPHEKPAFFDDDLLSFLHENNPNLKAFDYMTAREDLAIQLADKNHFPDMTLGVDYIYTASRTDANPVDNGKDPVVAMLSFNLPIWQQKYDDVTAEARARRHAVVNEKKEKENLLIADLEVALFGLRDADRKIDLYMDTLLPKAEQSLKVTELAFTADKATFLDLIDSQRILLGFQLEHKRALVDRAQRLAEIEMLTGGDMVQKLPE